MLLIDIQRTWRMSGRVQAVRARPCQSNFPQLPCGTSYGGCGGGAEPHAARKHLVTPTAFFWLPQKRASPGGMKLCAVAGIN